MSNSQNSYEALNKNVDRDQNRSLLLHYNQRKEIKNTTKDEIDESKSASKVSTSFLKSKISSVDDIKSFDELAITLDANASFHVSSTKTLPDSDFTNCSSDESYKIKWSRKRKVRPKWRRSGRKWTPPSVWDRDYTPPRKTRDWTSSSSSCTESLKTRGRPRQRTIRKKKTTYSNEIRNVLQRKNLIYDWADTNVLKLH